MRISGKYLCFCLVPFGCICLVGAELKGYRFLVTTKPRAWWGNWTRSQTTKRPQILISNQQRNSGKVKNGKLPGKKLLNRHYAWMTLCLHEVTQPDGNQMTLSRASSATIRPRSDLRGKSEEIQMYTLGILFKDLMIFLREKGLLRHLWWNLRVK